MTETLKAAIEALEKLPEKEQENWGSFILGFFSIHRTAQRASEARPVRQGEPYSSFKILREADFDLPEDYSVTYERALYGRESDLDG